MTARNAKRPALTIAAFVIMAVAAYAVTPSPPSQGEIASAEAFSAESGFKFAPLWAPLRKYPEKKIVPIAVADYSEVWYPGWQKELGISEDQLKALLAINAKAVEESQQKVEDFQALPESERRALIDARGKGSSPWRRQFENDVAKQIESVLTPAQIQTLREHRFPQRVLGKLYDAEVRDEIGFGIEQQAQLRALIKDRLAIFQAAQLEQADHIWSLLTPEQRTKLPEVVKSQGPTSAALSVAFALGFDFDSVSPSYPMLAIRPVRDRLKLTAEQETHLDDVIARTAVGLKENKREKAARRKVELEDKAEIEGILTNEQVAMLDEIDFRRRVVLALGYPEKRAVAGVTDEQFAEVGRLALEARERLYAIDRKMLSDAMQIATPRQLDQLAARVGWAPEKSPASPKQNGE